MRKKFRTACRGFSRIWLESALRRCKHEAASICEARRVEVGEFHFCTSRIQLVCPNGTMVYRFHFRHVAGPALTPITPVDGPGGRWYKTPGGYYPGISTVLAATMDRSTLDAWRDRIGRGKADKIASDAKRLGGEMHEQVKAFLLGCRIQPGDERVRSLVRALLPAFPRIDRIRHVGAWLYSDRLRVAGCCDLIAEFDGTLSVIDFKSAARPKLDEWMEDYYLGATAYAEMYRERAGIEIARGVILVAVPNLSVQVFETDTRVRLRTLRQRINAFYVLRAAGCLSGT